MSGELVGSQKTQFRARPPFFLQSIQLHTLSMSSFEYPLLVFGIQISITRLQAVVLMSFVRYHPLLLVNPPLDRLADFRWVFGPFG